MHGCHSIFGWNFHLTAKHSLYSSVGWWSSTSPRTSSGQTTSRLSWPGGGGRDVGRRSGDILLLNMIALSCAFYCSFYDISNGLCNLWHNNSAIKLINQVLFHSRALRRLKNLSNPSSAETSPSASPTTARRAPDLLQSVAKLNLLEEKLKQEFTGPRLLLWVWLHLHWTSNYLVSVSANTPSLNQIRNSNLKLRMRSVSPPSPRIPGKWGWWN